MEQKVGWWRKVVDFALSGLRTGFGLFRRNGRVEAGAERGAEVEVYHTGSNPEAGAPIESEKAEIGQASKAEAIVARVENGTGAEIDSVEMSAESSVEVPVDSLEVSAENRLEVEISCVEFENPEEEIALNQTSPQSEVAAAEVEQAAKDDPVAERKEPIAQPSARGIEQPDAREDQPVEAAREPEEVATAAAVPAADDMPAKIAEEAADLKPEQQPKESAQEPVPEPATKPKDVPERTTAEKVAAALKARGENAEQSPFSVIVGQVYDGPLDLLLDLIRKQDIDIYDIPIAKITAQFLAYVDHLRASDMDVAGEFIYTAALLIHIKSKMLLPRAAGRPGRCRRGSAARAGGAAAGTRTLQERRADAACRSRCLRQPRGPIRACASFAKMRSAEPEIAADTTDLVRVFRDILERARNRPIINVEEDTVTVGQMIQFLTRRLTMEDKPVALRRLLSHTRSERALIAMFLALLELVRLQAILLRQDRHFSEIFIKKHAGFEAAMNQGLADVRDDWR